MKTALHIKKLVIRSALGEVFRQLVPSVYPVYKEGNLKV